MVRFEEDAGYHQDHYFVNEDPARIYRGLKDLLVEEFGMDRIEEAHTEMSVSSPKDKIRMHAFKEKSRNTVLHFYINWRAKSPRKIYQLERNDEVLKARVKTSANVFTVYPGGDPLGYVPTPVTEEPERKITQTGLEAEHLSNFQKSKLYKKLVGLWYNKFYSKEIQKYKEEAEEIMIHLQNLMREEFGAEKAVSRSGRSQYNPPW